MNQLRKEGWIHHLARHAVACFLTRGDLYQSWDDGARVFEYYLLDADWSLNNGNWMWLSASAFFHQYFRVYSPIAFGKKTDPEGNFIRKYVPELKDFPTKYIYEPWTAPVTIQKQANCIIGKDYPKPIVDHAIVSKKNMAKMKEYFGSRGDSDESSNKRAKLK
jgi:cryptochrome